MWYIYPNLAQFKTIERTQIEITLGHYKFKEYRYSYDNKKRTFAYVRNIKSKEQNILPKYSLIFLIFSEIFFKQRFIKTFLSKRSLILYNVSILLHVFNHISLTNNNL